MNDIFSVTILNPPFISSQQMYVPFVAGRCLLFF